MKDYGFERENYLIFEDSLKIILIGYTKLGEIKLSNEEVVSTLGKNSPTYAKRFLGEESSQSFGVALEVNYHHKEDFLTLLELMNKNNFELINIKKRQDSISASRQKNIKNNENKI